VGRWWRRGVLYNKVYGVGEVEGLGLTGWYFCIIFAKLIRVLRESIRIDVF